MTRRPVAFINENELGHSSYLPRFAEHFERHPDLGVEPILINATPLPEELDRKANASIRGLRRIGFDTHVSRWRTVVSSHVGSMVPALIERHGVRVLVVNTQSVGLDLARLSPEVKLIVCMDATFRQLSRTPWFAPNWASRLTLPLLTRDLMLQETALLERADQILAWSAPVSESLVTEYGIDRDKIGILPPSLEIPQALPLREPHGKPRILFLGGDFRRKGGPLLLNCFRNYFQGRCELHIVTQSEVEPGADVVVHRGVRAPSDAWQQCWRNADVFVFPSTLETFGIVLVEALAHGVPAVSADVGAARMILQNGRAGWILEKLTEAALAAAIESVLADREEARRRVDAGFSHVRECFSIEGNARALAARIH